MHNYIEIWGNHQTYQTYFFMKVNATHLVIAKKHVTLFLFLFLIHTIFGSAEATV